MSSESHTIGNAHQLAPIALTESASDSDSDPEAKEGIPEAEDDTEDDDTEIIEVPRVRPRPTKRTKPNISMCIPTQMLFHTG